MKYSKDGEMYHLRVKDGDIGEYVLLPGDPARSKEISQYFDDPILIAENREYTSYTGSLLGKKVSAVSTGIGGPSTAIALEELVAVGGKCFIRVGTSGGIKMDVKSGDLVIATGSTRQDGTSREYAPIEFPAVPDLEVTEALVEGAKKLGFRYHTGIVQSKDSFYGQHDMDRMPVRKMLEEKWQAWKALNVLASEMESSTLFVISSYLGVKAGACFLVMANQEREREGLENPVIRDTESAIKVAIEALKILIRKEGS